MPSKSKDHTLPQGSRKSLISNRLFSVWSKTSEVIPYIHVYSANGQLEGCLEVLLDDIFRRTHSHSPSNERLMYCIYIWFGIHKERHKYIKYHTRTIQGPYKDHTRTIQGPYNYKDHTRTIQGPYKDHTRTIQGPYKDHTRTIQGPYKDHTRTIQGPYKIMHLYITRGCRGDAPKISSI